MNTHYDVNDIGHVELPEGTRDLMVYKCYYDHPKTTKLHTHGYTEIAFVSNGIGYHIINNQKMDIQKGDFFIFGKTPPHSFFPYDEQNFEKLAVFNVFVSDLLFENLVEKGYLSEEILEMFVPKGESFIYHKKLDPQNATIINNTMEKILYEIVIADHLYKKMSIIYFIQLLILVSRADSYSMTGQVSNRLEVVLNYIHDNYNKHITLSEIGKLISTSQSHFSKIFKKFVGMSITEYIQKIRIDKACELLISTDKPVLQISEEIGYENYRFFYSLFKKMMGVSPREYGAMHKKSYHIIKTTK